MNFPLTTFARENSVQLAINGYKGAMTSSRKRNYAYLQPSDLTASQTDFCQQQGVTRSTKIVIICRRPSTVYYNLRNKRIAMTVTSVRR
jgi:hypothetical protein